MLGKITSLRPVWATRDLVSITPPFQKRVLQLEVPALKKPRQGGYKFKAWLEYLASSGLA